LEWASWILDVVDSTGSTFEKPDAVEIFTHAQTYFDEYWAAQAELNA
jgi:hypothetical protein